MYHASGMIIGCAGSGKTTLLERLKGNDVAEIKQKTKSTRGIDIHTDIFDVSDTINVNTSVHKQHFKATFDEIIQIQNVLEHSQKETNEQHIEEQVENKKLVSEKISVKQTSKDNPNPNPGTDLSKNVTLPEKSAEKNEVSPNADKDSISEILRISSSDSDDPEKRITILDFAGQCAYYATHQVFMSPRAFFILVLNMEKKFDDQVGEEECSQTGSIFKKWTHRDYLKFWVKSIHQYSSDKAPVLLIATHAEEKTEEEEAAFFREIWKTLETKDKSLQRHLNVKRQFSVGFHDSDNIEKIKSSIAKIVQEMDHWGKELPRSWAMFENFFQEKKSQRIMHKETLKAFNDALPQEIKLRTVKDINVMLQFFHDIREILNFSQESLNEIIILDVQWFVNAFKNVITDKNHAEEDLFEYASEWENFNKTGELNDTLLTAIWKIKDDGYMKHKKDIMLYMEKLGLVAKLDGLTWYVPCMNKRPFPSNHFKSYPSSSILCYTFHFLPAGIFQRLVTACLQIPWEFASSKSGPFIYQNVAVFLFDNHNILLGMTQTEIQLQVFVIEGKVDTAKCQVIKTEIDKMLNNLSMTFHADLKYQLAFKCKPLGFCNDKESSVIKESDFRGSSFQCLSCPEEKMHFIDKQAITKYWVQMSKYEGECKDFNLDGTHGSRASKDLLATDKSNANIDRIRKLLQVGTDAVRVCFDKFFPKEDLEKTLKDNETNIRRGQFRFQPPQLEILFPTQDGSATGVSSLSMDVTIMYKLLRNFSDIAPPGNGWGKEPRIVDITESDDIERIRLYRNKYSHDPGSRPVISDDVFNIIWTDLSQALIRLSGGVLERRINEI
ncbi:uncharacterized protein LOC134280579 [Saccostrea cucullata]|uniref:uncharacterized protein LOC134280579 n=1 Tax=Saccostrea cuccullata TaxID=36930 RepID=UPI002ED66764